MKGLCATFGILKALSELELLLPEAVGDVEVDLGVFKGGSAELPSCVVLGFLLLVPGPDFPLKNETL